MAEVRFEHVHNKRDASKHDIGIKQTNNEYMHREARLKYTFNKVRQKRIYLAFDKIDRVWDYGRETTRGPLTEQIIFSTA